MEDILATIYALMLRARLRKTGCTADAIDSIIKNVDNAVMHVIIYPNAAVSMPYIIFLDPKEVMPVQAYLTSYGCHLENAGEKTTFRVLPNWK